MTIRFPVILVVWWFLHGGVSCGETATLPAHPNVLIFLIDDLGRCDIGVDGSTFHETPNLDSLAKSGVRFTDFYAGHPVCSPTRASLMTGKVPQRVGITDWIHPNSGVAIPSAETTLAEAFQSHGYQTAYLGKWHLGEGDDDAPTRHGFEWTRGVNRAGQPASYYAPFQRQQGKSSIWDVPDFEAVDKNAYLTDVLTDSAIEFLNKRDPDRPFLMCVGHYAIHTPIEPPVGLPTKYKQKILTQYGDRKSPVLPAPFESSTRGRQDNADYAAMMENLDTNIGRVLTSLDLLKLRDRTIIIFTSDNGGLSTLGKDKPGPTCNLPFRCGKGWTYEGGIRIPTFVSWPGTVMPCELSVPGYMPDLYPTLLELCDLPLQPDQHLDGRSLAKPIKGLADESLDERPLTWYYPHNHGSGHRPSAAIRLGNWKLIHHLVSGESELYNLQVDPGESHNLSSQHKNKTVLLRDQLLDWIKVTTVTTK